MVFAIFAGSVNEPVCYYIDDFASEEDAMEAAFECAVEDYQSYEGYHGIPSREDIMDNLEDFGLSDEPRESEIEDAYVDAIESWINYYVKEIQTLDDFKVLCEKEGLNPEFYEYLFME